MNELAFPVAVRTGLSEDDLHGGGRVTETLRDCKVYYHNYYYYYHYHYDNIRYYLYCARAYMTIIQQAVNGKMEAAR